jgi:hypothetical protein
MIKGKQSMVELQTIKNGKLATTPKASHSGAILAISCNLGP